MEEWTLSAFLGWNFTSFVQDWTEQLKVHFAPVDVFVASESWAGLGWKELQISSGSNPKIPTCHPPGHVWWHVGVVNQALG